MARAPFLPDDRRGSFNILMGFALIVILGFAALAVDWARVLLANAEAQRVADSAAEGALIALKQSGSSANATAAAARIIQLNHVGGEIPSIVNLSVGGWNKLTHTWSSTGTNAIRVTVGRVGANSMDLPIARLFDHESAQVQKSATVATQNLQVLLVMDITGSWDQDNFYKARDAAVTFLDNLHNAHSDEDVVGMVVFYQRFGYAFTPFTSVASSAANSSLVRTKWQALNVASLAGDYQSSWATQPSKHYACKVFGNSGNGANPWSYWCTSGSSCYQYTKRDNFTTPANGCFPNMPRYYSDEGGTDHTTGMTMAQTMFSGRPDNTAYRAMVVLTDGIPESYTVSSSSKRGTYHETRWTEYQRTTSHTANQIKSDTQALSHSMYTNLGVNTWFVSFVQSDTFMANSVQGDGFYTVASTASQIVPIFDRISRSMPIAVVE